MTKRFKKILFFGLCLFFLITAPLIIFYCQGYRFDFSNKKIVQVGGLFFKTSPPGVSIHLDQKLQKKTNFFFDSAFFSGLLPGDYEIIIQKTGYHSWTKTLTVKEKQVIEAKYITLFPKEPNLTPLAEDIKDFFPAPNNGKIIFWIEEENDWRLNSLDLQTQEQKEIISEPELIKTLGSKKTAYISFLNLIWSNDSKKILIEVKNSGQKQYIIAETGPETSLFIPDFEANIQKLAFNPNNSEELFFLTIEPEKISGNKSKESQIRKQVIFRLSSDGQQTELKVSAPSVEQNIISYLILDNNIIWLTDAGFLYQGQLVNSNKIELLKILNLKPIRVNKQANYQIIAKDISEILLKEDEELYYLNPETHLFEQLFNAVKSIEFSQDMKKILVLANNQISFFYLAQEREQPQRETGEKVSLTGFSEQISNLSWLNNSYLIFQTKDAIKVIEIDNRSKPNMIELFAFSQPKIFWNQKQKTLLVLTENNLFSCSDILK